jgi:hypothetical protein
LHDYEHKIPFVHIRSWAKDPESNIVSVWKRTTKEERKHMDYTIRDAKTRRYRPMTYTEKKRFSFGSLYPVTMDDLGKDSKYMIYYTLNVDDNYVFNKAKVSYYMDDTDNLINQTDIDNTMLDGEKKYKGVFELPNNTRLGNLNIIKLENVSFCIDDSQNNCNNIIDINVENTFSIE